MSFQTPNSTGQEGLTHHSLEGILFTSSRNAVTAQHARDAAMRGTDDSAILSTCSAPPKAKVNKRSPEYVWKSGLAGGLAGCAAKTIVGPLDRVKILFQASNPQFAKYTGSWFGVATAIKDIYHSNGLNGLFRGHSATLLRVFPYAGIKFLAYEQVRAVLIPNKSYETHWRRLLSGASSGCISVFLTYPLEVIRVRLAFETKSHKPVSLTEICYRIYHEHPPNRAGSVAATATPAPPPQAPLATASASSVISEVERTVEKAATRSGLVNFYRGFTPTLWGILPYAGTSFLTHDTVGDLMRHPSIAKHTTIPNTAGGSLKDPNKPAQLRSWAQLTAGGLAGFVGQTASYPLEVIRRRMQVGGAVGDGHRLRMAEVTRQVWSEAGWRGFFVGLTIGYVKVVPMVATSFYVYERGKYWLGI